MRKRAVLRFLPCRWILNYGYGLMEVTGKNDDSIFTRASLKPCLPPPSSSSFLLPLPSFLSVSSSSSLPSFSSFSFSLILGHYTVKSVIRGDNHRSYGHRIYRMSRKGHRGPPDATEAVAGDSSSIHIFTFLHLLLLLLPKLVFFLLPLPFLLRFVNFAKNSIPEIGKSGGFSLASKTQEEIRLLSPPIDDYFAENHLAKVSFLLLLLFSLLLSTSFQLSLSPSPLTLFISSFPPSPLLILFF